MKTLCCLFSYEITKGMKSRGPIGLLKKNDRSDELVLKQISSLNRMFPKNDLYVITGFGSDKMYKKLPSDTHQIINSCFDQYNQVYALKLLLNQVENRLDQYNGLFILNSDIILQNIRLDNPNQSCIITKHKHKRINDDYLLGVGLDNHQKLHIIFYNVGQSLWCNAVYLCRKDLVKILDNLHYYHDNMFLFEFINKAIDTLDITVNIQPLNRNSDCIIIRGPKDKYKII